MTSGNDRFSESIASSSNPGIKMVRSLQRRKFRQQERAFVVEGVRAVSDVIAADVTPIAVYIREGFAFDTMSDLPVGVVIRRVIPQVFDTLTDVAHPQGILAVVPMLEPVNVPLAQDDPSIMILDGVRDPGNMGTLFRSAAGAGLNYLVVGPECVDPYHPRAVRAAMGAHLRIPFSQRSWSELEPVLADYQVVALADAHGDAVYDSVCWTSSAAMVIGGEAFGPSSSAHGCAKQRVSIPLHNGVESLNAGVAGSLLAFESARQRRVAGEQAESASGDRTV